MVTVTVRNVSSAPSNVEATQAGGTDDGNSLSLPFLRLPKQRVVFGQQPLMLML